MNRIEIIQALQAEAKSNPASNAAFHVFAVRKRARKTVMLTSLYNRMRSEQFNYAKKEYYSLIKTLIELGFGTAVYNKRGRIIGVKDIETTLQSIGLAACGDNNTDFGKFRSRNKFTKTIKKNQIPALAFKTSEITLGVDINGRKIQIPLPRDLSVDEITTILDKFQ